jgi:hypothetical protein
MPIIISVGIEVISVSCTSVSSEKAFYNFVVADVYFFLHNVSQLHEHFFFTIGQQPVVLPQYQTKHIDGSVPYQNTN